MKRCNNCGWTNNPDSASFCEKCNSPLSNSQPVAQVDPKENIGGQGDFNLKGTILEMGSSKISKGMSKKDAPLHKKTNRLVDVEVNTQREAGNCPSCGYPLRSGCMQCPKCHTVIEATKPNLQEKLIDKQSESSHNTSLRICSQCGHGNNNDAQFCSKCGAALVEKKMVCLSCGKELNPTDQFCPSCGKPRNGASQNVIKHNAQNAFKKTISPAQFKLASITLTAINPYEDPNFEPLQLNFSEETILRRENVEAENPTISRNQQAVLSLEEGRWYLLNKAAGMSTALVLKEKHELQAGDVILIGNRIFEIS